LFEVGRKNLLCGAWTCRSLRYCSETRSRWPAEVMV